MKSEEINKLSNRIIGCAIKVHRSLGSGFREGIYSRALAYELEKNTISFARERSVKISYEGLPLGEHRLDFLIENELILEIKAAPEINSFHIAQILSYLKVSDKRLGLLLNFSGPTLQIKRIANRL